LTVSDEARFASLYELHQHRVTAYVRRRTEIDSVDDLTAEVFLTVWRKIDEAPEGDDAIRWLYRISYLVLTNHWRRSGRNRRLDCKLESIGIEASVSADEQVVNASGVA
jgi:DNA-directed RNA polymerase specialized sigma24 family protein